MLVENGGDESGDNELINYFVGFFSGCAFAGDEIDCLKASSIICKLSLRIS